MTDEQKVADFIFSNNISDINEFWFKVGLDREMSRIMKSGDDNDMLQYASGRIAEVQMMQDAAAKKGAPAS